MKKMLGLAMACAMLAACSSAPKKTEVAPAPAPAASRPAEAAPVAPPAESEAARQARLVREAGELAKQSVFFDYDDFNVKPQYQDVVKKQAAFMARASADKLVLEGNADERGSTEYNLALGQKRAEAVRKALVILGVADSRLEAISYGKEKPRAACHEERCWQENRRVDFVHKLK